jgi:hypothetical protein
LLTVIPEQLNAARGRLRTVLQDRLYLRAATILSGATCDCKEYSVFYYLQELEEIGAWPPEKLSKSSIHDILGQMENFDQGRMNRHKKNFKLPELKAQLAKLHAAYGKILQQRDYFYKRVKTLEQLLADNGIEIPAEENADLAREPVPDQIPPPLHPPAASSGHCYQCTSDWEYIVEGARNKTQKYFHGLCIDCITTSLPGDTYWVKRSGYAYDAKCRIKHGEPTAYFSSMGKKHTDPYR